MQELCWVHCRLAGMDQGLWLVHEVVHVGMFVHYLVLLSTIFS